MKDIQSEYDRENLELSEIEVIEILFSLKSGNGKMEATEFANVLAGPLEFHEFAEYEGMYLAKNVLRTQLGFQANKKPGDFDIIIVPYTSNEILFDRTAVCEMKAVRPTRTKPSKNADSLGVTQTMGLIDDGFPMVALFHISLTEPLKDNEKLNIKHSFIPANTRDAMPKGETLTDQLADVNFDHFQWYSADKQMKRLLCHDLPKYVGIYCLGLTRKRNSEFSIETPSMKFKNFSDGYFNPRRKVETVEKVKKHFETNPELYVKKTFQINNSKES